MCSKSLRSSISLMTAILSLQLFLRAFKSTEQVNTKANQQNKAEAAAADDRATQIEAASPEEEQEDDNE